MDTYITRSLGRRETWKGHDSEKNVRSAIRYARKYRSDLVVYRLVLAIDGTPMYHKIGEDLWDSVFFAE